MSSLLTLVEEATRSTAEGVKYFVEPAEDALTRATSKRHHIVFGRRGSGKSSLLRKAAADLTVDRRPIAWVDLEPFKNHSYPDLLLSVLISTFKEFRKWLETAAIARGNKATFWKHLFGKSPTRGPFNKPACDALVAKLERQLSDLEKELHSSDTASVKATSSDQTNSESATSTEVGVRLGTKEAGILLGDKSASNDSQSTTTSEEVAFRRDKIEFLRRHVMDYQSIFDEMAAVSGGDSFLFLDDLYQIPKADQPRVLDYFHSIAKGHKLWLKVGTIRHRSTWYIHGNPPLGVKLNDDANDIDLDVTLEKYGLAKDFLSKILSNFAITAGIPKIADFLTDGALDRLVLASGGVARDFLSIFRRSIAVARERGGAGSGGSKVSAEDINMAAGESEPSKREEFKRDTHAGEEASLDAVFNQVRSFCLEKEKAKSNCFLLLKDAKGPRADAIHELVDLKLLHLIRSRVTVNTRKGEIYEAYMLDLSQYTGARKRRGLDMIEFWHPDAKDALRKVSLILDPDGN